jgi:Tol biopolymer transport system component
LRKVFGDDSKEPRFIQTIPRSGYRIIATVSTAEIPQADELPPPPPGKYSLSYLLPTVLVFLLIATLVVFYFSHSTPKAGAFARVVPFTSFHGREDQAALSPDGNQIAFVWGGDQGNNIDIYVKSVAGGQPLRLTEDPGIDLHPTWSPDGQRICFIRLQGAEKRPMLFVKTVLGTTPERSLGPLNERASSLSWSPDGKLIALSEGIKEGHSGIVLLSPESGERRVLSTLPPDYWGDSAPAFSPDGSTIAFVRENTAITGDIYIMSVKGGEPRRITNDNAQHTFGYGVSGGLSWTEDGGALIFCSTRGGTPSLWKVSLAGGEPERIGISGDNAFRPTVSHQGNRLAYTQLSGGTQVYTVGLEGSKGENNAVKFLDSTRDDTSPQFSPDGKRVTFESNRSGTHEIWMCDRDGRNLVQLTSFGKGFAGTPRWSPDSKNITFDYRGAENADVYVVNINDAIPRRVTSEPSDDSVPSWSSDGHSIFFASNRTGNQQIWTVSADGGAATQVTKGGGFTSFASPDGKYLYYTRSAVDVGVWRKSLERDDELLVLQDAGAGMWGRWQFSQNTIYFVSWSANNHYGVEVFDLNTKTLSRLLDLSNADEFVGGFAVSPDGKQFLYTLQNSLKSDVMLVENFH